MARNHKKTRQSIRIADNLSSDKKAEIIHHLIDRITKIGLNLIKFSFWGYVSYCCLLALKELAGEKTDANISIAVGFFVEHFATERTPFLILFCAFLISVFVIFYYRRLYKNALDRLKRMAELELLLDPNRSSSGLIDGWKSNDEDQ